MKKKEIIKAILSILLMLLVMFGCGYMWYLEDKHKKENKDEESSFLSKPQPLYPDAHSVHSIETM